MMMPINKSSVIKNFQLPKIKSRAQLKNPRIQVLTKHRAKIKTQIYNQHFRELQFNNPHFSLVIF